MRFRSFCLYVAVPVTVVGATLHPLWLPASTGSAELREVAPAPAQLPAVEAPAAEVATAHDAYAALAAELRAVNARLNQEVQRLDSRVDGLASMPQDASVPDPTNAVELELQSAAEPVDAQALVAERTQALAAQLAADSADVAATTRLQDHLQQAVADSVIAGHQIAEAQCTASLCRFTLDDLSGAQVLDDLALLLPDGSRTIYRELSAGRYEFFVELAARGA